MEDLVGHFILCKSVTVCICVCMHTVCNCTSLLISVCVCSHHGGAGVFSLVHCNGTAIVLGFL